MVRDAVKAGMQRCTHPLGSVSNAISSAGANALALRSNGDLSNAGDVITAIGPYE